MIKPEKDQKKKLMKTLKFNDTTMSPSTKDKVSISFKSFDRF